MDGVVIVSRNRSRKPSWTKTDYDYDSRLRLRPRPFARSLPRGGETRTDGEQAAEDAGTGCRGAADAVRARRKIVVNKKPANLQDGFLNQLRRQRIPITLFLSSGVQLRGQLAGFDSFVMVLESP